MQYFINENLQVYSPSVEVSESAFELFRRYAHARKGRTWIVLTGKFFSSQVPEDSLILTQVSVLKRVL